MFQFLILSLLTGQSFEERLPDEHRFCQAHLVLLNEYARLTPERIRRTRHSDYKKLDSQVVSLLSQPNQLRLRALFGRRRPQPRIPFRPVRGQPKAIDWDYFDERREAIFKLILEQNAQAVKASQLSEQITVSLSSGWQDNQLLQDQLDRRWSLVNEGISFDALLSRSELSQAEADAIQDWVDQQETLSKSIEAFHELDAGLRQKWYSLNAFDFNGFPQFFSFVFEFMPFVRNHLFTNRRGQVVNDNFGFPPTAALIRFVLNMMVKDIVERLVSDSSLPVIRPRKKRDGDLIILSGAVQLAVFFDESGEVSRARLAPLNLNKAVGMSHQRPKLQDSSTRPAKSESSPKVVRRVVSPTPAAAEYVPPLQNRTGDDGLDDELTKMIRERPAIRPLIEDQLVEGILHYIEAFSSDVTSRFLKNLAAHIKAWKGEPEPVWVSQMIDWVKERYDQAFPVESAERDAESDAVGSLRSFATGERSMEEIQANRIYTFYFDNLPALGIQKLSISDKVRSFLIEEVGRENPKNWIKVFIKGLVSPTGYSGLKRIAQNRGQDSNRYEVKIMGRDDRILVYKNDGVWEMVAVFDDHYLRR